MRVSDFDAGAAGLFEWHSHGLGRAVRASDVADESEDSATPGLDSSIREPSGIDDPQHLQSGDGIVSQHAIGALAVVHALAASPNESNPPITEAAIQRILHRL